MNPELPQVRPNPESMPGIPGGIEYRPPGSVQGGERPAQQSAEQLRAGAIEQAVQPAQPPVIVASPPVMAVSDSETATTAGANPIIAADDDLIEREWVDQVKKIIALTRDDPYERARVIAQLQADYLKKRYNKQLGRVDG